MVYTVHNKYNIEKLSATLTNYVAASFFSHLNADLKEQYHENVDEIRA
jgi:hypothetical protein